MRSADSGFNPTILLTLLCSCATFASTWAPVATATGACKGGIRCKPLTRSGRPRCSWATGCRVGGDPQQTTRPLLRENHRAPARSLRALRHPRRRHACRASGGAPGAAELCRALCDVHGSPVVTADETSWRVAADLQWLWAFVTPATTVYAIQPGRGLAQAAAVIGRDYAGVLQRDGWQSYRQFHAALHQTCLAHLLRRCRILLLDYPQQPFVTAVKAILQAALRHAGALSRRHDLHPRPRHRAWAADRAARPPARAHAESTRAGATVSGASHRRV